MKDKVPSSDIGVCAAQLNRQATRAVRVHSAVTLLSAFIAGCSSSGVALHSYQVKVPAEYSSELNQIGVSEAQQYRFAYQEAWWACVARFANDINYEPSEFDRAGNGWPAAVLGYEEGYRAAESRIHAILLQYGSERAQLILRNAKADQVRASAGGAQLDR